MGFIYEKKHDGIFFNYIEKGEHKNIHVLNHRAKRARELKNLMLDVRNLKEGQLKRLYKELKED